MKELESVGIGEEGVLAGEMFLSTQFLFPDGRQHSDGFVNPLHILFPGL